MMDVAFDVSASDADGCLPVLLLLLLLLCA